MRRTQLVQGGIPWGMRAAEEGWGCQASEGTEEKGEVCLKVLQWDFGNIMFCKLYFLGKFHLATNWEVVGRAEQESAQAGLGWSRNWWWKRSSELEVVGKWHCSFALEHNQPKGAMLAVGFPGKGSQALFFQVLVSAGLTASQRDFWGTAECRVDMDLVSGKCIFPELFFWKQNCRSFSFIFHFKNTNFIDFVPGRTCLSLSDV